MTHENTDKARRPVGERTVRLLAEMGAGAAAAPGLAGLAGPLHPEDVVPFARLERETDRTPDTRLAQKAPGEKHALRRPRFDFDMAALFVAEVVLTGYAFALAVKLTLLPAVA